MDHLFQALWVDTPESNIKDFANSRAEIKDTKLEQLTAGEVVIKTQFSGINYKDALAVTGSGLILRQLPLVPGIDMAGTVIESRSSQFKEGDEVIINGCNFGEKYCGGFSEYVRAPQDIIMHKTKGLSLRESMIFGTAGFTAALAIHEMEKNGLRPERGEVLVTGATGGVGSSALSFLNKLGYETEAWTRRDEHRSWLEQCGAAKVTNVKDKDFTTRSLESVVWAGCIDNVGGESLSYILPRMDLWSSVACIGLAGGEKLSTTVFPMILRGVNLLGVSSNNCPFHLRKELWQRMGDDMKPHNLEHLVDREITLAEIPQACQEILRSQHLGRLVVKFS